MAKSNPDSNQSPQKARQRSPWERAAVWIGILLLVSVVFMEWRSREGYRQTLKNIEEFLTGGSLLPLKEVSNHVQGFAFRGEATFGKQRIMTLTWPSLFKVYKLGLPIVNNEFVKSVEDFEGLAESFSPQSRPRGLGKMPGLPEGLQSTAVVKTTDMVGSTFRGTLPRELVRQAMLITAQQELGISTLDASLGEVIPETDRAESLPFVIQVKSSDVGRSPEDPRSYSVSIELSRNLMDGQRFSWSAPNLIIPAEDGLEALTVEVESLSRSGFIEAWKKSGLEPASQSSSATAAETAAASSESMIGRMDPISQFAALRQLHSAGAASNKSPDVLSGLTRAYANLGSLTDFHWSASSKAYKARSLFYAQRLIAVTGETPYSLAHRAYSLALTGRLATAQRAIDAARSAKGQAAPDWLGLIEAYCQYKLTALEQAQKPNQELALYLTMRMLDPANEEQRGLETTAKLLTANPACTRATEFLAEMPAVGIRRQVTEEGFDAQWPALYARLAEIPQLPESARQIALAESKLSQSEPQSEYAARAKLMESLRQASTRDSQTEFPSWPMLADLLKDLSFVQSWRRLDVEANALAVNSDATLALVKPLVAGHRFENFLQSFAGNRQKGNTSLTDFLKTVDDVTLELPALPIILEATQRTPEARNLAMRISPKYSPHRDEVHEDIARLFRHYGNPATAAEWRRVNPGWPHPIVGTIERNWESVQSNAEELERTYAKSPAVLNALARRLADANRTADAIRCLKAAIDVSPSHASYMALAELYKRDGDSVQWKAALDRALEIPSPGLDSTRIEVELASDLMRQGNWKQAEPHARAAAQSFAAMGLLTAARCAEGSQDWDQAERFQKLNSERYQSHAADWYFWCIRTGRGDVAAAKQLADANWSSQTALTVEEKWDMAVGQFIVGQVPQARTTLMDAFVQQKDVTSAMFAMLLADQQNDVESRDSLLTSISFRWYRTEPFPELCDQFVGMLNATKRKPWNPRVFDWLATATDEKQIPLLYYFAGMFLLQRGESELAEQYLQVAATSYHVDHPGCLLATLELRRRNIQIGATRSHDWPDWLAALVAQLQKSRQAFLKGNHAEAEMIVQEVRQSHADFLPAILASGSLKEARGDYPAAIREYQAAIQIDRSCSFAHYLLSSLLSTCEQSEIRNGLKALDHAEYAVQLRSFEVSIYLSALAAAHAECGHFKEAAQFENRSWELNGNEEEAVVRLKLYREGKPYHRPPKPAVPAIGPKEANP